MYSLLSVCHPVFLYVLKSVCAMPFVRYYCCIMFVSSIVVLFFLYVCISFVIKFVMSFFRYFVMYVFMFFFCFMYCGRLLVMYLFSQLGCSLLRYVCR